LNQASYGAGVAMVGHTVAVAPETRPSPPRVKVTAPAVVARPRVSVAATATATRRRSLFLNAATCSFARS
jgi:hypothetical protein